MNTTKKQNAMKTRVKKGKTLRYTMFLNYLRAALENTNVRSIQKIIRSKNVDVNWSTFLIKIGAISKNANGFYKWNDEIKIDVRLVTSYRKYKHAQNNKRSQQTDMFKPTKTRKPKSTKKAKEEKVGLIRRFLNWLY